MARDSLDRIYHEGRDPTGRLSTEGVMSLQLPHEFNRAPSATALWRAVGRGFERLFHAADGFEAGGEPSSRFAMSGVPVHDLNCGIVDAGDNAAFALQAMSGRLQQRRLPGIVLVTDAAHEANAAATMAGMIRAGRMPLMTLPALQFPPESHGFAVRTAITTADLSTANRLMASAFDLPAHCLDAAFATGLLATADVRVHLVLAAGEPVGALQTTVSEGMVGVWSMATPPDHRHRGIARAGLTHALATCFQEGCHTAFLIATDAGRPLYDSVGFSILDWCTAWVAGNDQPPKGTSTP